MKFDVELKIRMSVEADNLKDAKELVRETYDHIGIESYSGKGMVKTLKRHKILSVKERR